MSKKKKQRKISKVMMGNTERVYDKPPKNPGLAPYLPAPGVIPEGAQIAMDSVPYGYLNELQFWSGSFPGFPWLASQAQRPEYRKIVMVRATEMTRKWIELKSLGDDDKADRVKELEDAICNFRLRDAIHSALVDDGFFGRGQIYLDVDTASGGRAYDDDEELGKPLFLAPEKIKKGSLRAFRVVEPFWTYPGIYQSTNPLAPNFYEAENWYVMAKIVHRSRMLTFISHPVPDMLKPAYAFAGLSLIQISEPYVNNFLRTRDSIGDIVHSYSLTILKTNMQDTLSGQPQPSLSDRADLFNQVRDNRGLMMLDKDEEDVEQINTPLSGLSELQAQAQEQMCSVTSTPVVKLLGIQPSGLNASSQGELESWGDHVRALQEQVVRGNLQTCLKVLMLHLWGEIDDSITFDFCPLEEMNELELAQIRKANADTDAVYVDAAVISQDEVRERLASDKESPYHSLDLSDAAPSESFDDEGDPA